jgi:hypothetical protein
MIRIRERKHRVLEDKRLGFAARCASSPEVFHCALRELGPFLPPQFCGPIAESLPSSA